MKHIWTRRLILQLCGLYLTAMTTMVVWSMWDCCRSTLELISTESVETTSVDTPGAWEQSTDQMMITALTWSTESTDSTSALRMLCAETMSLRKHSTLWNWTQFPSCSEEQTMTSIYLLTHTSMLCSILTLETSPTTSTLSSRTMISSSHTSPGDLTMMCSAMTVFLTTVTCAPSWCQESCPGTTAMMTCGPGSSETVAVSSPADPGHWTGSSRSGERRAGGGGGSMFSIKTVLFSSVCKSKA